MMVVFVRVYTHDGSVAPLFFIMSCMEFFL